MELIKRLCEAYGPSGREDKIRKIIESEIKPYCKRIEIDALGNLIAYKEPIRKGQTSKRIMFCAHMDEIGLIVKYIDRQGFLRFTNIGGIFPDRLINQRVIFENGTMGIIGVETKPETPKPVPLENMFIDIGARGDKEAKRFVKIGDIATFFQTFGILNKKIVAKAMDDRIGCWILIEVLKRVKNNKDELYFVFSVQEELGSRGARTGAFSVNPHYAIAVDVTATGDTPESPKMAVELGKGVALKIKDSAFLTSSFIKERLILYAQKLKIPFQLEILEKGTTDASVIQLIREGVQSGVLSVPTRYVHSPNEVCEINDARAAIKLLAYCAEKGFE
uniref:M42 family peptidase n=1 Tax=candidate division WOR-3 bacterium TaxID=2052148 RepID=A0A7C4XLN7_UNCW3